MLMFRVNGWHTYVPPRSHLWFTYAWVAKLFFSHEPLHCWQLGRFSPRCVVPTFLLSCVTVVFMYCHFKTSFRSASVHCFEHICKVCNIFAVLYSFNLGHRNWQCSGIVQPRGCQWGFPQHFAVHKLHGCQIPKFYINSHPNRWINGKSMKGSFFFC